jgi:hypothetical protein
MEDLALSLRFIFKKLYKQWIGAGIAQSVLRLASGWTTESTEIVDQINFGAHRASYPKGNGDYFSGGKGGGAWSFLFTATSAKVKKTWTYSFTPSWHST